MTVLLPWIYLETHKLHRKEFYLCVRIRAQPLLSLKRATGLDRCTDQISLNRGIEQLTRPIICDFRNLHLGMFDEKNTKSNLLPRLICTKLLVKNMNFCLWQGGGSANKTFLYQGTPSLLKEDLLLEYG